MKEPQLVRVEWVDAAGAASWVDFSEVEGLRQIAQIVTVGFLVKKTEHGVYLVMGYSKSDDIDEGLQPFFIPKGIIKKITKL